ncbi:MAG: hypothetical protein VX923_07150 [Pseudomonadota bacterium]|nr:hypothetical protein [Pseudomonadota bacterium]
MKPYFISPVNKQSLVERFLWTKNDCTIYENCRWSDGVISILVPTNDPNFNPHAIVKNISNEWNQYDCEMKEGFDGEVEWDYGNLFKQQEWEQLFTKTGSDIREELQKLGWRQTERHFFIEGEIEIESEETIKIRNNYNLEW